MIDNCFKMIGNIPIALTFLYLVYKAEEDGRVNATYEDMAKALNRPKTTMYRYVTYLVKINLVEQRRNKGETKTEQKRTILYIPQISHYKQVRYTDKKTEWNKSETRVEQERNKNTSVKRTLEERKKDFVERLKPYIGTYGKDMLNDFYRYWAQVNDNGKKMLWEKQKCFEISLRLATWKKNETERCKQHTRTEDIGIVLTPNKDRFKNEEKW